MAGRDARHERHPVLRALGVLLVLTLVAGAVAAWRYDLLDSWLEDDPAGPSDPAAIAPPPELDLEPVRPPDPVAPAVEGRSRLEPAAVRRALAPYLGDRDLGRHVLAEVSPLTSGPVTLDRATGPGGGLAVPASTTKLVTVTAALFALGADHTFDTTVIPDGRGRIVLVGGGDPFLAAAPPDGTTYPVRADVVTLAQRTAVALRRDEMRRVQLGYDDSLFTGPSDNPRWEPDYVPDGVVAPISSLWVDEGRPASGFGRVADPALAAAQTFAAALGREGIMVTGAPARRTANQPRRADPLARVTSAPLSQIVERVLEVSDNEAAEVLLRHVGREQEGDASFEGGQRGVERVLAANGIRLGPSVLYDGSGLSRQNRLDPQVLTDVLRLATRPGLPGLRPVLTGLPVAGYTGSLTDRMDQGPPEGRGRVRAKTGTLDGVTSLAGIATDLDGNAMVFVLMADRLRRNDDLRARVVMDNAAAALGACRCGR